MKRSIGTRTRLFVAAVSKRVRSRQDRICLFLAPANCCEFGGSQFQRPPHIPYIGE